MRGRVFQPLIGTPYKVNPHSARALTSTSDLFQPVLLQTQNYYVVAHLIFLKGETNE